MRYQRSARRYVAAAACAAKRLGFAGPGSGRAEIALTLLADALGDEARAMAMHETFSRRVVALFP
jgi:hypothetical protein